MGRKYLYFIVMVGISVSACAEKEKEKKQPILPAPAPITGTPSSPPNDNPGEYGIGNLSQFHLNRVERLLGIYSGTIYKVTEDEETLSQSYTLRLSKETVDGSEDTDEDGWYRIGTTATYAYYELDSEGDIGNIHMSGILGTWYSATTDQYVFFSDLFEEEALSDSEISIQLNLRPGSHSDFDPARSQIFFLDRAYSVPRLVENVQLGGLTRSQ